MPPRKTDIQKIIRNCQAIQKKMDECVKLFAVNADILTALATGDTPGTNGYTPPTSRVELSILTALASCAAIGVHNVPRPWLAVLASTSPKGSPFKIAVAKLAREHSIRRPGAGILSLAEKLRGVVEPDPTVLDIQELITRVAKAFRRQEADLLWHLAIHAYETPDKWMTRQQLAKQADQNIESSAFRERLTQLRENGFVEFGPNSTVRATLQWFTPQVATA